MIYVLRRDLRLYDNPIFEEVRRRFATAGSASPVTHLLPIYVVPAAQVEISGFLSPGTELESPYPEARSRVAKFWRCGPHRARFLAESLFDLRRSLESCGSGLVLRVGTIADTIGAILETYKNNGNGNKSDNGNGNGDVKVCGVWITEEEAFEEKAEERDLRRVAEKFGVPFKLWRDEKYYIHHDDLPNDIPRDARRLPDVFTQFRNMVEPLRKSCRSPLSMPSDLSLTADEATTSDASDDARIRLPPLPAGTPPQKRPFALADDMKVEDFISRLLAPLQKDPGLTEEEVNAWGTVYEPSGEEGGRMIGGERMAHKRLQHLITSGAALTYKQTRNQMLGPDFSTRFSAPLALGCITARQINKMMVDYEEGKSTSVVGKATPGFGSGENEGTGWIRFELLWRDYFRLCTRKYGIRLFTPGGFREDIMRGRNRKQGRVSLDDGRDDGRDSHSYRRDWRNPRDEKECADHLRRILTGTTGLGLIDASQRELYLTGWTSNRARQNVACFFAKHMNIDWRIGAEWYEMLLVDHDVNSNWANWQYVAGVGNDVKEARLFNPIKQSHDYDPDGKYIKYWVKELRGVDRPDWIFLPSMMPLASRQSLGLTGLVTVEKPLKRIEYKSRRPSIGSQNGASNLAPQPGLQSGPQSGSQSGPSQRGRMRKWGRAGEEQEALKDGQQSIRRYFSK